MTNPRTNPTQPTMRSIAGVMAAIRTGQFEFDGPAANDPHTLLIIAHLANADAIAGWVDCCSEVLTWATNHLGELAEAQLPEAEYDQLLAYSLKATEIEAADEAARLLGVR